MNSLNKINGQALSSTSSKGKVKHVVCKLEECWLKLAQTESNVFLFCELLKRNISTRDVFYFALKQAKIRRVHKKLDPPLTKAAMRAKLNDACATANRLRQKLKKIKLDLLSATGNKRFKHYNKTSSSAN